MSGPHVQRPAGIAVDIAVDVTVDIDPGQPVTVRHLYAETRSTTPNHLTPNGARSHDVEAEQSEPEPPQPT